MIMKRQLMAFISLFFGIALMAAPVSQEAARQKALQFLSGRSGNVAAARGMNQVKLQLKEGVVTDQLYVFNVGQKDGFVIVSGDDCTGDLVLGYADKGEISAENMPDNLRSWLQGYADQIQWMKEHGVRNDAAASRGAMKKSKTAIPAMLTTKWNQSAPYNNYCPKMTSDGSVAAVTGCVATATAQVMYYQAKKHNITSTTTTEIPGYQNQSGYYWYINGVQSTSMPAKSPVTIDWTKIPVEASPSTDDAKEQVARLMEYIGAGVQMQYRSSSDGGSSASQEAATSALVSYFGYDPDAKSIYRDDFTDNDWEDAIYTELSTNGPVLYSGQSNNGGHAFVIDGYDHDDYFYVNWGWGGLSDGSFRLSVLSPHDQGIGGSGDGYNFNQMAMINVSPEDDGVSLSDDACLTVTQCSCNVLSCEWYAYNINDYCYEAESILYSPTMYYSLNNNTGWDLDFERGIALYQNGSFVKLINGPSTMNYPNGIRRYGYFGFQFGEKLSDGEYRLVAVSRKSGTDAWRKCIGADETYVKVTVSSSGQVMSFENMGAIKTYAADGTEVIMYNTSIVTTPDDALALDVSQVSSVTSVTPNSNPNTLYFVGSSVPSGLTGKNVIQNGNCATLTLTDGNGFYSPVDFTATKATYTRQFTQAATGTGGWNTIVVPFNVSTVKQGSKVIDWFHSGSDTGKNFWLKQFSSDGVGSVNFSYATALNANTPYIIAVPGNSYGAEWNLTNKDITFEGSGVVNASSNISVSKTNYEFIGMLAGKSVTGYMLNAEGSQFKNTTATVNPFRAYFKSVGSGSLGSLAIGSDDDVTGIKTIGNLPQTMDDYYNLQGRKVVTPTKGLYIVGGKKVVVK